MDEKLFDYTAIIDAEEKKAKAEDKEVNMSVRFSVEPALSIFLIEARKKIWCEKKAKEIYGDIGERWNTKLTSRFKAYMQHNQIYYYIFDKLRRCLKKTKEERNRLLNEGECALIATYGTKTFCDPYGIMPPKKSSKNKK